MDNLKRELSGLRVDFELAYDNLNIDAEVQKLSLLESEISQPEIWNNPTFATEKNKEFSHLQDKIQPWLALKMQINDIIELMDLGGEEMLEEFNSQIEIMKSQFSGLKKELLFDGEYDDHNVIFRITSGVGGVDAQDWAQMLERMYLRFFEKNGFEVENLDRSTGEEAGIKTSVMRVSGNYVYGRMKSENGVHRLVRLSPFNSDNLRQTSFALVEVLPEISPEEVQVEDKDLKIDVYRSGGHGGQSVNTTDSAVRVTHLPTGISVAIQNERSQLRNKETALKILTAKLAQMKIDQHAENMSELQAGESASWGSQIRNYVLHPYTLVKDTRTKFENKDVKSVLDGDISGFIDAYLESLIAEK